MIPQSPYYLISTDGILRFTSTGKAKLRERFQMAKVNMDEIRTFSDYIHAQRQASDFFGLWLTAIASDLPRHGQYALLRDALLCDTLPTDF